MQIIFLPSTIADLRWFRRYYQTVFPEGKSGAKVQYARARHALLAFPQAGHEVEGEAPMRELHIPQTAFSLVYFIERDSIIVTRLLDSRALRPQKLRL